jgi:hypothetical protein
LNGRIATSLEPKATPGAAYAARPDVPLGGPNHLGWFLSIVIPGSLLPAILIRGYGINQSRAVLEQVST